MAQSYLKTEIKKKKKCTGSIQVVIQWTEKQSFILTESISQINILFAVRKSNNHTTTFSVFLKHVITEPTRRQTQLHTSLAKTTKAVYSVSVYSTHKSLDLQALMSKPHSTKFHNQQVSIQAKSHSKH